MKKALHDELSILRESARPRVSAKAVADALGITTVIMSRIENGHQPKRLTPAFVRSYRAAVKRLAKSAK